MYRTGSPLSSSGLPCCRGEGKPNPMNFPSSGHLSPSSPCQKSEPWTWAIVSDLTSSGTLRLYPLAFPKENATSIWSVGINLPELTRKSRSSARTYHVFTPRGNALGIKVFVLAKGCSEGTDPLQGRWRFAWPACRPRRAPLGRWWQGRVDRAHDPVGDRAAPRFPITQRHRLSNGLRTDFGWVIPTGPSGNWWHSVERLSAGQTT